MRFTPESVEAAFVHLGLVFLGAWVAVMALVVSRRSAEIATISIPWGLALALAASVASGVLAWQVWGRPRAALSIAGGWFVVVVLALLGRPEGDFVLVNDGVGLAFLGLGAMTMGVLVWRALVAPSHPSPPGRR